MEVVAGFYRGSVGCGDDVVDLQAGLLGGLPHDAGSLDGALLGGGMGGEQDRVAGLQADQNLENGGRGGVGGGGDGAHNAHRLGNALGAEGLILGDDSTGLHVAEIVVDMLGGIVVLDDLILDDAHAGLGVGHLGQGDTGLVGGHGGLLADLIDLLLGELAVDGLGFPHLCQLGFQRLEGSNFVELLCHRCLPISCDFENLPGISTRWKRVCFQPCGPIVSSPPGKSQASSFASQPFRHCAKVCTQNIVQVDQDS